MSMEFLKAMVNIIGMMVVYIKVISVMEQDMDMEFGKIKIKHILAPIKWTIKKDLEFILGKIKKFTKVSSKTIIEMDTVKCMH